MSCSTECTPEGYAYTSSQRVIRFNDWSATVTFFASPDGESERVPLNLAGYSQFEAVVFVRQPSEPIALISVDTTEKNNGVLTFNLPAQSDFFTKYPASSYRWQFSMKSAAGKYRTFIRGAFEVLPNG